MKYQKIDDEWIPFVKAVQRRLDKWGWGTGETDPPERDLVDAISRARRFLPQNAQEQQRSEAESADSAG